MEQIEEESVFKGEDLFNTKRNTENENRVTSAFPFNEAK